MTYKKFLYKSFLKNGTFKLFAILFRFFCTTEIFLMYNFHQLIGLPC